MRRQNVDYVVFSRLTQPASVLAQLRADPTLTQVYADPKGPPTAGRFVVFRRNGATRR